MSRYFNETSKANKWADSLSTKLDIHELLSPVSGGEEAVEELEKPRLSPARKMILPIPTGVPLLTRQDENLAQVTESYRTLRTRILRMNTSQGIRSIVLSSSQPGEGKTLTTVNLALCCTQISNFPVLVVDADFRTRGLTHLLDCPRGAGLSELLSGEATYDQVALSTNYPNLSIVTAGGATASPAELFATVKWKEFIGWATERFSLVLIDSPPVLAVTDFELISVPCDGTIFVIRGGFTNREMIRRAATQVGSGKLLGSVFNMSHESKHGDYLGYSGTPLAVKDGA
jgi:protein-tyrosine kinase